MNMFVRARGTRGFTLIELLVVIAIIGVLASVVLASLNSARAKARDAKVVSDFKQLQAALELYRHDNGTMPVHNNSTCCVNDHVEHYNRMAQDLVNGGYMSSIPQSPSSQPYMYYYYGGTTGGLLVATLESIQPTTTGPYNSCRPWTSGNWCSQTANRYYCVCNP